MAQVICLEVDPQLQLSYCHMTAMGSCFQTLSFKKKLKLGGGDTHFEAEAGGSL